jgi:hypothetical protein
MMPALTLVLIFMCFLLSYRFSICRESVLLDAAGFAARKSRAKVGFGLHPFILLFLFGAVRLQSDGRILRRKSITKIYGGVKFFLAVSAPYIEVPAEKYCEARDRNGRCIAPCLVTAEISAGKRKRRKKMKTNTSTNTVNQQVVLRDKPQGMAVKTRIKAGLKIKL